MDMRRDNVPLASKIVSRRDLDFLLYELLDVESLCRRPRFAEHSRETFSATLDTAFAIAEEKFAPHNRKADENEPHFRDGRVEMIPEVGEAVRAFGDAGFIAATYDVEQGGMQLPFTVAVACVGIFRGANVSTDTYGSLTQGAADLVNEFGTAAQKKKYLEPMLTGRFAGTMVLTEPQAGSSLADVSTMATSRGDGTWSIKGSKIFITAGDHEITENIVHLVLARTPGAPKGVKGISLFIVPKRRVNDDASLGTRNDVSLAGLIHKMGFRGATSTMLNFGESGECIGELLGEEHQGLACMFQMMNGARIGVGLGAAALGYTGYLHALDYARERRQGREGRDPAEAPVPIVRHPDVRRMLLAQKAIAEGAYALCLYAALLHDRSHHDETEVLRREAGQLLDLLTPIVKAWPSQHCVEANSLAIQVHGGYGYTRDYPVEQFFRDNRLNAIHEGTNGIQAIDLLGRKVFGAHGGALGLLEREVSAAASEGERAGGETGEQAGALAHAWHELIETTRILGTELRRDPRKALANSHPYLEVFGHPVVAWLWLRQATLAARALAKGAEDPDFYQGKLAAARYFFRWELPSVAPKHALLRSLDTTTLEVQEAWL